MTPKLVGLPDVQANCVGAAMTSQSHSRWYRDGCWQGAGGRESGCAVQLGIALAVRKAKSE